MRTRTYRRKRKKTSKKAKIIAIILAAVLLFAVADAVFGGTDNKLFTVYDVCEFLFPHKPLPDNVPDWVERDIIIKNRYSRPGIELKKVDGIVIHYVGNPGSTAEDNRNYFNNLSITGSAYASSHFIVGLEGEVIQCVPLNEIAYCSNNRNDDTLSIECCHPDSSGKFNAETYESLVKLTAWLCNEYDLKPKHVIRHYDVSGKNCPKYFVENESEWENFKNAVASAMEGA